MALFLVK